MTGPQSNLTGIGLMLLAVLIFSINDVLGKWLVGTYSVSQILLFRSCAALMVLAILLARQGWPSLKLARPGLEILRVSLAVMEVTCFYWAVAYLPLADAMTYYLAGPIYVTVLSGLILQETIGWRRWTAVLVGFAGVLIALRPSASSLSVPVLLAIAGSLFFGLLMIVTRQVRGTPDLTLAFWQFLAGAVFGAVTAPINWVPIKPGAAGLIGLLGVTAIPAMLCVTRSLKLAPASVVVPYQYTLIIWAVIFGYFVFGDVPTWAMLLGAAIIVASGLYIFLREQRLARTPAASEAAPLI